MSRDMLDRTLAGERSDRDEYYEPGTPACPPELVKSIVGYFQKDMELHPRGRALLFKEMGAIQAMHISNLEKMISPHVDGVHDANIFIDSVLKETGDMNPKLGMPELMYLDRLLQALYNVGFNDFHITLNSLATPLTHAAYRLEGTEENPLKATYVGDVSNYFGNTNKHCNLTLLGKALGFASESQNCMYTLEGATNSFGGGSSYCEFHLPDMKSCLTGLSGVNKSYFPTDCSVHVHSPPDLFDRAAPLVLYREDFYRHRNRLHVKMKDSSWKEWRFP